MTDSLAQLCKILHPNRRRGDFERIYFQNSGFSPLATSYASRYFTSQTAIANALAHFAIDSSFAKPTLHSLSASTPTFFANFQEVRLGSSYLVYFPITVWIRGTYTCGCRTLCRL